MTFTVADRRVMNSPFPARLVLGALHIGFVGGIHDDPCARLDMRWHHHACAIVEHCRLVGGRGRLTLDHGVRLDDLAGHRVGQADPAVFKIKRLADAQGKHFLTGELVKKRLRRPKDRCLASSTRS